MTSKSTSSINKNYRDVQSPPVTSATNRVPTIRLSDFKFFRMWPRALFQRKDKKGELLIRKEVKELQLPGVYILYKGTNCITSAEPPSCLADYTTTRIR